MDARELETGLKRAGELGCPSTREGMQLLDDLRSFIGKFCVLPNEHALVAVTLWAAHAHMVDYFHTSPRLVITSPELASGKTRVLEVLATLVPSCMQCLNANPAGIFRTLAKGPLTLLVDEVDGIFNKRGTDDSNLDLRAMLNGGYKRGATIPRCVGPKFEVQNFPVFCATVLAGIGDLPDTIMSRAVIIRMRRRAPTEPVESFRSREQEPVGNLLRDRLADWCATVAEKAGKAWPDLPLGVTDRPAEVWEPLLAAADAAGGLWPTLARAACVAFCSAPKNTNVSLGIRLLADMRTIFGESVALPTKTILERLHAGPEAGLDSDAPWADLHGSPLGVRELARKLDKYGVSSLKVKVDGKSLQGYRREHLWDAWQRYLPPTSAQAEPPEPEELQPRESQTEVPEVPQVPVLQRREGGMCIDCAHFELGSNGGLGWCEKYQTETAPSTPFECAGFEPEHQP